MNSSIFETIQGGSNLPCKNLVDALNLSSTIGTSVAAGGVFSMASAGLSIDDMSTEDWEYRQYIIDRLTMSGLLFGLANVIGNGYTQQLTNAVRWLCKRERLNLT